MEAPPVGLAILPDETLVHCLSFLTVARDLLACSLATRHLHALSGDDALWRKLLFPPPETLPDGAPVTSKWGWCVDPHVANAHAAKDKTHGNSKSMKEIYASLSPPPLFYDRDLWFEQASAVVSLAVLATITCKLSSVNPLDPLYPGEFGFQIQEVCTLQLNSGGLEERRGEH